MKFRRGGARTLREARGAGAGDSGPAGRALTTHAEQRHGRGADQPPPHLSRSPRRAAPSFLSAGAAPPRAVRLAGPAATHGARRRPRSPLPRSRPGSHGRSEKRKGLRLRRPTEDWARPRGAIAAKRERPELPPVTRAGSVRGPGRGQASGPRPQPIRSRPVCRPRPLRSASTTRYASFS